MDDIEITPDMLRVGVNVHESLTDLESDSQHIVQEVYRAMAAVATDWQPIETAPSGTWLLLWTPPESEPGNEPWQDTEEELRENPHGDGRYLTDREHGYTHAVQWVGWKQPNGHFAAYYSGTSPHTPTHWKPLGPPPSKPDSTAIMTGTGKVARGIDPKSIRVD